MTLRKAKLRRGPGHGYGRGPRKGAGSPAIEVSRDVALLASQVGLDRKARGVKIIDVQGKVDYADYLVLMTGTSDRHVASIARGVEEELSSAGHKAVSVEGLPQAQWVLVDLVDVVVHVFHQDTRPVYDLDGLWIDARRVPVPNKPDEPRSFEDDLASGGPPDAAADDESAAIPSGSLTRGS